MGQQLLGILTDTTYCVNNGLMAHIFNAVLANKTLKSLRITKTGAIAFTAALTLTFIASTVSQLR